MSNSTTLLDTISSSQASKEITANAMLDQTSPAALYGRRASTTTGLTWGYTGGYLPINGVMTAIANGTVALTASQTNYVEASRATGVVSANITAHTPGAIPLYTVVCGALTVTSYTDIRITNFPTPGRLSLSVAGSANVTLARAQAHNDILNFTGILTGSINVIVPNGPQEWDVFNNTTGAYTLTVKTSAGTGIAVTQGKSCRLAADGTNVVAVETDFAAFSGGTLNLGAGTVSLPSLTLAGYSNTGLYNIGAYNWGFSVSGAKVLDISSAGLGVTGSLGVGAAAVTDKQIYARSSTLSSAIQTGIYSYPVGNSSATTSVRAFFGKLQTSAAAFTVGEASAFYADDLTKGAGSTVTSQYGLFVADQTQGASNYGIRNSVTSGANKWGYYGLGTANNAFAGNTRFGGVTAPVATVDVTGTIAATTGIAVGGATPGTGGIAFPATAVAVADANTLDDYDQYTAASTACTGAITTACVWKLTVVGNKVTLTLPAVQGAGVATTNFTVGLTIPAKYRPAADFASVCAPIIDNAANKAAPGAIKVTSAGVISVWLDGTFSGNFTVTANAGLAFTTSVSWTI